MRGMTLPGGFQHGVALFQIVLKAAVPVVILEVVQEFLGEFILAVVSESGIAVAVGDECVIPLLHGQQEQFPALFPAVSQRILLIESLSGIIDRVVIDMFLTQL